MRTWMTVEVPERMNARGQALVPLDEASARRVARRILRLKPEAIAICLLHSYINDAHEVLLADAIHGLDPRCPRIFRHGCLP